MDPIKKEGDKEDTATGTRERTRTETTILSSELESSTFDESSVSGPFSPRGRAGADASEEASSRPVDDATRPPPLGTGLSSLNEEQDS